MNRVLALLTALLVGFLLAVPSVAGADGSLPHTGRVLVATAGDLTVAADEQADLVVVTQGTATIEGDVNTVIVVDGVATLTDATTETVIAIRTPVTLAKGAVVLGEVLTLDSEVTRIGDARVRGGVRDIALDMAGVGLFLGPALLLIYLGFALAAVTAGLLLAGLAARQVRTAERVISREPLAALAAGLAGVFLPILLAVPLFVTVVGAPLALAILVAVLPAAAFVGYLVAGIWIGDWLLARMAPGPERRRPYLPAALGILVLQVLGIWPPFTAVASLFGYGAVVLVAWRTLRGPSAVAVAPHGGAAPALQAG